MAFTQPGSPKNATHYHTDFHISNSDPFVFAGAAYGKELLNIAKRGI
jgi:hypothetical protein